MTPKSTYPGLRDRAKLVCVILPPLLAIPLAMAAYIGARTISMGDSVGAALARMTSIFDPPEAWALFIALAIIPYALLSTVMANAASRWPFRTYVFIWAPAWIVMIGMMVWGHWAAWASADAQAALAFMFLPIWAAMCAAVAGFVGWLLARLPWLPFTSRYERIATGRCAQCGYDLLGITSDTCPECGAKRTNSN